MGAESRRRGGFPGRGNSSRVSETGRGRGRLIAHSVLFQSSEQSLPLASSSSQTQDPAQAGEGRARHVLWAPAGRMSHSAPQPSRAPAASAADAAARGRARPSRTRVWGSSRSPCAGPPVSLVPTRL